MAFNGTYSFLPTNYSGSANRTTTYTSPPSYTSAPATGFAPTANLSGMIGHGGVVGTAGAGVTYQGVNNSAYVSAARNGSTFNNKGSNTFTAGARFNF